MQSLYESRFLCISKSKADEETKYIYQKKLFDIFQFERQPLDFLITSYELRDPVYNTVKSTINIYTKNVAKVNDQELNQENINNLKKETKKFFCTFNKNENFKNISFLDQIGEFYEKTLYFMRYANNIIKIENSDYDTKIVEISRCGYNMGEILKNMGYKEIGNKYLMGFYYKYKYFPIVCLYARFVKETHIFLQVIGYYTESSKKEVISEMDKIKEQLKDLFYIKI
jgi:hypothetical protein